MSFREYVEHGWKICALGTAQKGPLYKDWQTKPIPVDAADGIEGAGLLHALSGTAALDLDNVTCARAWLAERGVDLDAMLEADSAVQISSGTPNRAKLLFKMKHPLRTFKPEGSGLELRCATASGTSVHDALPGSTHPSGRKYEWTGGLLGDWRSLPTIPANLLSVWRDLEPDTTSATSTQVVPYLPKKIDLVRLRKAAFKHSPDCEYPEWIKVGMQLHDATDGDGAGFDIWREWSRGIKRKEYPGDVVLKSHWLSFESTAGKHVASGDALAAELPAERDDFEDIPAEVADAPAPEPTGKELDRKQASDKLIERFVFVVGEQDYFDTERNSLIGDKAIRHLMTPYMPRKNGREVDPIDKLMRSRTKNSVEAMAFHPGEKAIFTFEGKQYANTFYPGSVPAPVAPMKDERDKIEWLFNRVYDEPYREWLRQFYAHMAQHPGIKIRSAPLIWSDTEGNGKSTLAHVLPQLLAGQYWVGANQSALNSDFNDYLIGKWLLCLTEFRAGSRGERATITKKVEEWIADDAITLTVKGARGYSVPNHLVVTASTNADDAAQIGKNNRKWAIHRLDAPEMTEAEKAWLYEGFLRTPRARPVLWYYFLNVPITTFSPHADAIKTKDRAEMIDASTPADLELLTAAFEEKSEPLSKEVVITREVTEYVCKHCHAKPSNDRIGKLLCKPPFNGTSIRWKIGEAQYRGVAFKPQWLNAGSKAIMAHIAGDEVDLAS